MNEAKTPIIRLWYCDVCDKKMIITRSLRHNNSESHKHKEKYVTVVKEY